MFKAGGLIYRMNSSAGTKQTIKSNNCLTDQDYEDNIKYFLETKGQLNDLMDVLAGVAGKVPAVGKIFGTYNKCAKGFDPMITFIGDYGRKIIIEANKMKSTWYNAINTQDSKWNHIQKIHNGTHELLKPNQR